MRDDDGYLLANRQREAGVRFDALAHLFDATTFRHLQRLGVQPGWRCWEVGAGGPSVPRWLAERVGPGGQVVVTDIDTSWLDEAFDECTPSPRATAARLSGPWLATTTSTRSCGSDTTSSTSATD